MKIGKLSASELKSIVFNNINKRREEFLNSPLIGDDCAAIAIDDKICYISSDPITGATANIGKLAVDINCNDIATAGVLPVGIMVTVLAPPTATKEDLKTIIGDMEKQCSKLNIDILGGHTEITDAVNKIILSVTGIGIGDKSDFFSKELVISGDIILLTKGVAIEGSAIIAHEKEEELKRKKILSPEELDVAKSMINLTCVLKEGVTASKLSKKMHDVTEGGILGGIWEMAESANLGVNIFKKKLSTHEVTAKICAFYSIDPLKLISSGSMLIVVSPENKNILIKKLMEEDIKTFEIGVFIDKKQGKNLISNSNKKTTIFEPKSDELYQII